MNKKDKVLKYAIPLFSVTCIFVFWALASNTINSDLILPNVKNTFISLFSLLKEKSFYTALAFTLLRSLIAFCISFAFAFIFAILSVKSRSAKRFILPIVSVIRALPTIAVVLLLLFWTSSNVAPVVVTSLIVIPTAYTNLVSAFSKVDAEIIETCKFFNVPKNEIFFKVKMPTIFPDTFRTIGSGLSLNLKLMVAAEVLSSTANSMGYLLNTAKVYYEISSMLALVFVTVVIGLLIETLFNVLSEGVDYENKFKKHN